VHQAKLAQSSGFKSHTVKVQPTARYSNSINGGNETDETGGWEVTQLSSLGAGNLLPGEPDLDDFKMMPKKNGG
jgi:hypothetical protein